MGLPMRTTNLYQIYDAVANTVIGPIIVTYHPAAAVRQFTDLLRDPKTTLAAHPEDYELRYLGQQDESTGLVDGLTVPQAVLTGLQWKLSQERADSAPQLVTEPPAV